LHPLDGVSPSEPELGAFRIDRPVLREASPRRTFVL
jgi:hypothetical protein